MRSTRLAGALVALTLGLLAGAQQPSADVYIVRNNTSNGSDSLRSRINDANDRSGHDTIGFRIPGDAARTITPLNAPLPTVTETVTVDGYSQPGSSAPAAGANAVLKVAIDASNHNVGLDVAADDVTIRELAIHRADLNDRNVIADNGFGGVSMLGDDNRVRGNAIATDPDATTDLGNEAGVWMWGVGNTVAENLALG
jgi:hypothetical protein